MTRREFEVIDESLGFRRIRGLCKSWRTLLVVLASAVIFTNVLFTWDTNIKPKGTAPVLKSPNDIKVVGNPEEMSLPSPYKERLDRLQQTCSANNGSGHTENILVYRNMAFGVVAKAGCTFWIRVFRFLNNDTYGRHLDNPFQMTRNEAHGKREMKVYRLQNEADRQVVMDTTRFMVARNPFSRIFSAYMDKLYLPDMWAYSGKEIASLRSNISERDSCGHDVSFPEFLSFVAYKGEKNVRNLNGHWRPIEHSCNPCTFKPHIVSKQESFSQDSRFILERFGLGHLLVNHRHDERVIDEMRILIDWNLGYRFCVSNKDIALRLWRTFVINGYLRPGSEKALDAETNASLNKAKLTQLVTDVYRSDPVTKQESKEQRVKYLKDAYKSIPQAILQRIIRLYWNDFVYFDYSTSIEDLS